MTYLLSQGWAYSSYSKADLKAHKPEIAQIVVVGSSFLLDGLASLVLLITGIIGATAVIRGLPPAVSYSMIGVGVLLPAVNFKLTHYLSKRYFQAGPHEDRRYFLFWGFPRSA